MKKRNRVIFLMLTVMMTLSIFACSNPDIITIAMPEDNLSVEEFVYMDLAAELIPLTASPSVFTIPVPTASGSQVSTNARASIDFSNARDGYVMIRFLIRTSMQLRVRITGPSGVIYQYRLNPDGRWEVFPLSDGNGRYTVAVFEQVQGTSFATVNTTSFSVTLRDEFAPFLRPNQFVNFSKDSNVTSKAAELTRGISGVYPRVEAIYNFVIGNISYDRVFAREVQQGQHSGYVPDVDAVLARGKGICFDYAALMTAMLRSLGIPTRLVVGYAGDQYHAWIDVFSEADGWINNIIHFNGKEWNLMDPTFAATGNQNAEVMRFIGDGKNYSPRFLY
ncbi:MAG: transglutaminase domain-containing protein [Oscillospiraceae bacterium]|nr:transglutaminase domain-containing protein [Oscillospiraceae bacterium]